MNCYSFIVIKWHNDYSTSIEDVCNDLNQSALEYETYRYNMYRFLYNVDNNNYDDSYTFFKYTYYITVVLITIILISYIKNILYLKKDNLIMLIIFIFFYISYIYIGNIILKIYDDINEMLYDKKSDIYKYAIVYKVLNAIMYINNFRDNVIGFSNINIRPRKFDDIIENNISSYINSANTAKITDIKLKAYSKLDFLKYITFDRNSPYYFKSYFKNIYCNK
jgi:hypothetical protein